MYGLQGVRVSLALAVPVRGLCNKHGFGALPVGCRDMFTRAVATASSGDGRDVRF
jgi:hypothetical protein